MTSAAHWLCFSRLRLVFNGAIRFLYHSFGEEIKGDFTIQRLVDVYSQVLHANDESERGQAERARLVELHEKKLKCK